MICRTDLGQNLEGRFVSGVGVSSLMGPSEFHVVAHEIGHNFGASHDCGSNCDCGDDCFECCSCFEETNKCDCNSKYLMNPTSSTDTTSFSPCTRNEICKRLESAECLKLPGSQAPFTGSFCGNGVKEIGEECDCGTEEECKGNPCCTTNCKLKAEAQCNDGNGSCCKNCKIVAKNSLVCRPAESICDKEEFCDGQSIDCPKDVYNQDGTSCGDDLYCIFGQCTNRNEQCKSVAAKLLSDGECAGSDAESCVMMCNTQRGCLKMPNYYLDGTKCRDGKCQSGYCIVTIQALMVEYKWIILIGGSVSLLLLILLCLCYRFKVRSK